MISEKLKPTDDFWLVSEQEKTAVTALDTRIANIRSAIGLAERMLALRGNAGWSDFVKAIEDCRAHRRIELELSSGAEADLRVLQGRCRELGAIVSLMNNTERNLEALSSSMRVLEEERRRFVRSDGKVLPQGIS